MIRHVTHDNSVLSGVGFGAYCAVDFALVMDVLPNDREKAKDLAVWHQVAWLMSFVGMQSIQSKIMLSFCIYQDLYMSWKSLQLETKIKIQGLEILWKVLYINNLVLQKT